MAMFLLEDPDYEAQVFDQLERLRLRREQAARMLNEADDPEQVSRRASDLSRAYPGIAAGVVAGMATAGIEADSPEARAVAERQAEVETSRGFGLHTIGDVAKAGIRTAFTAFESAADIALFRPFRVGAGVGQEVFGDGFNPAGLVTGIPRAIRESGESSGVIALRELVRGNRVNLGSGFFPAGDIAETPQEQERLGVPVAVEAARQRAQVELAEGVAADPGSLIAVTVTEPGTRPYELLSTIVNLGYEVALDPAAAVGRAITRASKARKGFTGASDLARVAEAGGIDAARRGVDVTQAVDGWLRGTDQGRALVEFLTRTDDFDAIYKGLNRQDAKLALDLADATSGDEVVGVLRGALTEKPVPAGFTAPLSRAAGSLLEKIPGGRAVEPGFGSTFGVMPTVRRKLESVRLVHNLPGMHARVDNVDALVLQADNFAANAKLPAKVRAQVVREFAELEPGDVGATWKAVHSMMKATDEAMSKLGVETRYADDTRRMIFETSEDIRQFFIDRVGNAVHFPGAIDEVVIDGQKVAVPSAHLMTEYLDNVVSFPDPREIRRLARRNALTRAVYDSRGWELNTEVLDAFHEGFWKPAVLARAAWPVRVILEEQIRMGSAGLDSLVSHPLRWLSFVVGHESGRIGALAKKLGAKPRGELGVTGDLLSESREFQAALTRGSAGFRNRAPEAVRTGDYVRVLKDVDPERAVQGWGHELAQLWSDDIARRVAAGGLLDGDTLPAHLGHLRGMDALKAWFWEGDGAALRRKLAQGTNPEKAILASSREAADGYIDSVLARVHVKTGGAFERTADGAFRITRSGSQELLDAIASGRLDDIDLLNTSLRDKGLREALKARTDAMPPAVKVPRELVISGRQGRRLRLGADWDAAVEWLFSKLMSHPTNALSRSPAFRQFYWDRVADLVPYADEATRAATVRAAEAARVPPKVREKIVKAARGRGVTKAGTVEGIEHLDEMAKGKALSEVRALLYDLNNRSQFADIFRVVAPFAEAWKEIITTWARLTTRNPLGVTRRFQQTIEGAQGLGFFYTDPITGEEVFAYPGGGLVAGWMFGDQASVRLQGRIRGLNLIGAQIIPGVGPAVQIAASHLLPDRPEWEFVREQILPFGETKLEDAISVDSPLLPAWVRKWISAAFADEEQDRQFLTAFWDSYRAHALADGGATDPESVAARQDQAKRSARWLFLLRGAAQFVVPTGPSVAFEAKVEGEEGARWMMFRALADEWHNILNAHDGDTAEATVEFMDRFGQEPFLLSQGTTISTAKRAITDTGYAWEKRHPELVKKYPNVIGLFAPDTGEFSYDAWLAQYEDGARENLTVDQAIWLANNAKGWAAMNAARSKLEGRDDEAARAWERQVRERLRQEYPGFDTTIVGLPQKRSTDELVKELTFAVRNEQALRETPAGRALTAYLEAQDRAQQIAEQAGYKSWRQADAMAGTRAWLLRIGERLSVEEPAFAGVWREVLVRQFPREER